MKEMIASAVPVGQIGFTLVFSRNNLQPNVYVRLNSELWFVVSSRKLMIRPMAHEDVVTLSILE